MRKIAITGAKGVVGSALTAGLQPKYDVIQIDLPEIDARDEAAVARAIKGATAVVHLAGVFGSAKEGKESWSSPYIEPDNMRMVVSVLRAAQSAQVPQFIHASSIHVEDTHGHMRGGEGMLQAMPRHYQTKTPSGYGENKRLQEQLIEAAAPRFAEGAVGLRLGGVNPNNRPPEHHADSQILEHEQRVWLDHADLVNLVEHILEHPQSEQYHVIYAVSDNPGRFHDISNPFGWEPSGRQ